MRVLISAGWLGGAGGAERALHNTLAALSKEEIDLVVNNQLGGHLASIPASVDVQSSRHWRFRGSSANGGPKAVVSQLINPIRRGIERPYDLHLAYHHGPDITTVTRAGARVFIPCGNRVTWGPGKYDMVGMEAPDNRTLLSSAMTGVLLPPPLLPLAEASEAKSGLPIEFFLTVFNPYDAVKGADDLLVTADSSPLPIVWCHSNHTLKFAIPPRLASHRNIIHIDDPTPGTLRYLYEQCRAYLGFSRGEGFGWAIADALNYSRAIVARRVGVLSFTELSDAGVYFVGDRWEFDWSLLELHSSPDSPQNRDLSFLSADSFRHRLAGIVAGRPSAAVPSPPVLHTPL